MTKMEDDLILVNASDDVIGKAEKKSCHIGDGILHRAFSIFIINSSDEVLIHKRSHHKMLWPGFWSNSCCSHPRYGESLEDAVHRRLMEELSIRSKLSFLYSFTYQAKYLDIGSENELCHVYAGRSDDISYPKSSEIVDIKYVHYQSLTEEINNFPDQFTPWFKLEWNQIIKNYANKLSLVSS